MTPPPPPPTPPTAPPPAPPRPAKWGKDPEPNRTPIDEAEGGAFGRGGDAFDQGRADHERQCRRGQGDDERAGSPAGPGSLDVAQTPAAVTPPHQRRQRDRQ